MTDAQKIPERDTLQACWLVLIGRLADRTEERQTIHLPLPEDTIRQSVRSAIERAYGTDYLQLVDMAPDIKISEIEDELGVQIRVAIECYNNLLFDDIKEQIAHTWNGLHGFVGSPFVGRQLSERDASAVLDKAWSGLL